MNKKTLEIIFGSGIWLWPISYFTYINSGLASEDFVGNITLSILPTLVMAYYYFSSHSVSDGGKRKAQHPPMSETLKFDTPNGYPLGRYGKKYVCMQYDAPGNHNILINGSSGTGKSSTAIIPAILDSKREFLIGNDIRNEKEKCHFLILDVKGEIASYTRCPNDGSILFDPQNRNVGWGFDPLWGLDKNSSEQTIKERMETIAISIVPVAKGDNAIWGSAARNLLTGLMIHFFKYPRADEYGNIPSKVTFPALMRMISLKPIKDTIKEVVSDCDPNSAVHMYISSYDGMADETLSSVEFNMRNVLSHLGTDKDLIYAMDGNPRKFNPTDLLSHSIYVIIPMDKMETYGVMWNILSNLCLKYIMGLSERAEEPDRPYFGFIFDEAGAIYSQTKCSPDILISALKLIRSKGGVIICANQDVPSYGSVMDDKQLHAFLANFQYMVVLDAVDTFSQKEFADLIPKFQKRKISYSGSGKNRRTSKSWQDAPIYEKADLASLGRQDEFVLISAACISDNPKEPNPGFATIKKCPYYKDSYYKKLYDKVKEKQKSK